jgi:NTE family protein
MTIKHIVLSSGSYKGVYMLGVLKHLKDIQYYSINNIENIYAVSVGSILAVLLAMKLDLNDITDYVINRPWEKLFSLESEHLINSLYSKGMLDINIFYSVFENFFKKEKINKDITMKEFYDKYKIRLQFIALNINTFENEILSHEKTPDLKIVEAVYMSCSLPFIFVPNMYNNNYYLDGGLINPYPLKMCINENENEDEIISIFIVDEKVKTTLNETDNILTFGLFLFNNLIKKTRVKYKVPEFKNEILIPTDEMNMTDALSIINNTEVRGQMIEQGIKYAKLFVKYSLKT